MHDNYIQNYYDTIKYLWMTVDSYKTTSHNMRSINWIHVNEKSRYIVDGHVKKTKNILYYI